MVSPLSFKCCKCYCTFDIAYQTLSQLKVAKVVLKIDSSSWLLCVYSICMYKLNDALIFEHFLLW